jgi:anti-sigma regulatory factor (Ser/Thr protein kinase)
MGTRMAESSDRRAADGGGARRPGELMGEQITRFCFSLAAEPEAASHGRVEMSSRLGGLIDDIEMEIALLLLSEAVTNAYLHGRAIPGATIEVEGHLGPHVLWVGVTNDGPPFKFSPTLPAHAAPHGRGLFLLSSLSRAWGIANASGSTSVWFELEVADGDSGARRRVG